MGGAAAGSDSPESDAESEVGGAAAGSDSPESDAESEVGGAAVGGKVRETVRRLNQHRDFHPRTATRRYGVKKKKRTRKRYVVPGRDHTAHEYWLEPKRAGQPNVAHWLDDTEIDPNAVTGKSHWFNARGQEIHTYMDKDGTPHTSEKISRDQLPMELSEDNQNLTYTIQRNAAPQHGEEVEANVEANVGATLIPEIRL